MRSSKSTSWPSKSGPSVQANIIDPPTLTRQPPHIPVPSTMIGFRLTMVLRPWGRVVSAQAFIMMGGPMATTSSISACFAMAALMPSVTSPLSPTDPSSVQMMNSSQ